MQKKAAVYDPYLDTLGGGERYCLTVAEILIKNGYQVDLFWSGENLLKKAHERFSLNLNQVRIIPDIFKEKPNKIDLIDSKEDLIKIANNKSINLNLPTKFNSFVNKYKTTKQYDVIFYLSDGSIPFLFGKKNFLHTQVPFVSVNKKNSVLNKLKHKFITNVICNSQFTSKYTHPALSEKVRILYPPVDIEKFTSSDHKENIILSVGRFDNILNAKKQDVLIDSFAKMINAGQAENWKLVLAGGSLEKIPENKYLSYLKKKSSNLPVEFLVNPGFEILSELYSVSKIYWHAAGYEVNEDTNPEEAEHFGMTIVEAMASGVVPVVIAKGGIPEIVNDGVNGYLWTDKNEMADKTEILIQSPKLLKDMSKESIYRANAFSKENFEQQFLTLLNQ